MLPIEVPERKATIAGLLANLRCVIVGVSRGGCQATRCGTRSAQTDTDARYSSGPVWAARTLGLEYQVEKVSDLKQIMSFGVMTTPALVVDGVVKVSGRVPKVDEIKKLLA